VLTQTYPAALNLGQGDLPIFTGREKDRSVEEWVQELKFAVKPYAMKDDVVLGLAIRAIKPDTPAEFNNFEDFEKKIKARFAKIDQSLEAVQELKDLKHSITEGGVNEYASSFELVCKHVKLSNREKIQFFISGPR